MKRGEIWWVKFDFSIGSEVSKTRPAVVVSNDSSNTHVDRVQVVPLSSQVSKVFPCEALIDVSGRRGKAMADQIMTVSKKRVLKKLGDVLPSEMVKIERALKVQLQIA
jgi:mRNA interferase MazF